MRNEYVKVIKEYITQKIQLKYTLPQMKEEVIRAGATIEEFNEAVRQLTSNIFNNTPSRSQSKMPVPLPPKTSKLNLLKDKRAMLFLPVLLVIFLGYLIANQINNSSADPNTKVSPKSTIQNPAVKDQGIIGQVYANMQAIDPERAFSYPKSNIPLVVTNKPKKEVLGFLPYWMLSRADDINLDVLTSVSLFGLEADEEGDIVTINSKTNEIDGGWQMWKDPMLDKFIKRAKSKGIKIFLTLKAFDSDNINNLVASDEAQKSFISNALYLISSKNLDGINIDFEYVGSPTEETRKGFTRLITNLNSELKRQFPKTSLTLDTYAMSGSVPGIFELELLSSHVDAFVIMGYDFHTPTGAPGPISPMGGNVNIIGLTQGYLEKVPADKLILAVPYYGYDWPIASNSTDSQGNADILPYSQIAETSAKQDLLWDDISQAPSYSYTQNGTKREVHFENVRSLGIKYDFVNSKNLKGVGIWALGYDGFNSDLQRLIVDKFAN